MFMITYLYAMMHWLLSLFGKKADTVDGPETESVELKTLKHDKCKSCNRKRQPSPRYGDKYLHPLAYLEAVRTKEDAITKYRGCPTCGSFRRRGRSPRNAQGREEERQIVDTNLTMVEIVSVSDGWFL